MCWFSCFCCCPRNVVDSPLSHLASTVEASPLYSALEDRVGSVAKREIGGSPESRSSQRRSSGEGRAEDFPPPKTGFTRTSAPWSNKIPVRYGEESPDRDIGSDMEENSPPEPKGMLRISSDDDKQHLPGPSRSGEGGGSAQKTKRNLPPPSPAMTPYISRGVRAPPRIARKDSSDSDDEPGGVVKTQKVWHIHPRQGQGPADRPYEISAQGVRFFPLAHTETEEP